jgi:hypothetical protein
VKAVSVLKKFLEGIGLNFDEIGRPDDLLEFSEVDAV